MFVCMSSHIPKNRPYPFYRKGKMHAEDSIHVYKSFKPKEESTYCAASSFCCFAGFLYTFTGMHSTTSFGAGTDPIAEKDGRDDKKTDC